MIFSFLSFAVAIPSAIKVFNWTATLYKASISYDTPMLYALGLHWLVHDWRHDRTLCCRPCYRCSPERYVFRRRPLPLHHGRWRAAGISGGIALLVAQDNRPHVSGGMGSILSSGNFRGLPPDFYAPVYSWLHGHAPPISMSTRQSFRFSTFSPQLELRFSVSGLLIPLCYLIWSMRYGKIAEGNPWNLPGLEWRTQSPPPTENFEYTPIVTWEAYEFAPPEETKVVGKFREEAVERF